jgi:polysaccharide biosynthesis/export protein
MVPNDCSRASANDAFSPVDVSRSCPTLRRSRTSFVKAMIAKFRPPLIGDPRRSMQLVQILCIQPIALVLALIMCTSCQTSSPQAEQVFPNQTTAKTKVTLAPGDVIKLTFAAAPDLNQSQKIRADGKVSLPQIGEVTASGKTVVDFQSELVRLYKSQLRNSDVVVTLESSVTQVVVSGAVGKPGKLTFDRPTTVFQAIMEAGGATDYGTLKKVHLVRVVNGEQLTQFLDLRPTASGQKTSAFYVRDGDVIYVPQTVF